MGVLVDWQIKEYIEEGRIGIDPFDPDLVQSNSLDVRLGDDYQIYDDLPNLRMKTINPYDPLSVSEGLRRCEEVPFITISPGDFILATTKETLTLPADVVASIEGKSSLARLGIQIHQTGGWIDAGFSGEITLELANINVRPVRLYSGMPIGQLVFYQCREAEVPYSEKLNAKYLNQKGATASRYPENRLVDL